MKKIIVEDYKEITYRHRITGYPISKELRYTKTVEPFGQGLNEYHFTIGSNLENTEYESFILKYDDISFSQELRDIWWKKWELDDEKKIVRIYLEHIEQKQ